MVYLDTTIKQTGKVERSGPYDREFIENWVAHQKEMHACQYVSYEIVVE